MRVVISDLTIGFGSNIVIQRLDAEIHPNRVTLIVGPSGAGKTSLLAAIAGQGTLSGGTVALVDQDGTTSVSRWNHVVWIPQTMNALGARTVTDNAMVSGLSDGLTIQQAADRALEALAEVGLADKASMKARFLSGGELQRLAIARAIVSDRPLLLADEPTANLDEANGARIGALLRKAAERKTVVVATHDPALFALAHDVITIRRILPRADD